MKERHLKPDRHSLRKWTDVWKKQVEDLEKSDPAEQPTDLRELLRMKEELDAVVDKAMEAAGREGIPASSEGETAAVDLSVDLSGVAHRLLSGHFDQLLELWNRGSPSLSGGPVALGVTFASAEERNLAAKSRSVQTLSSPAPYPAALVEAFAERGAKEPRDSKVFCESLLREYAHPATDVGAVWRRRRQSG
jgi:hypothetical protein